MAGSMDDVDSDDSDSDVPQPQPTPAVQVRIPVKTQTLTTASHKAACELSLGGNHLVWGSRGEDNRTTQRTATHQNQPNLLRLVCRRTCRCWLPECGDSN
jgi:hypothetical protein